MDSGGSNWTILVSPVVAFGVGILALTFLMKIIKIGKIFDYSYCCCGTGVLMIILT